VAAAVEREAKALLTLQHYWPSAPARAQLQQRRLQAEAAAAVAAVAAAAAAAEAVEAAAAAAAAAEAAAAAVAAAAALQLQSKIKLRRWACRVLHRRQLRPLLQQLRLRQLLRRTYALWRSAVQQRRAARRLTALLAAAWKASMCTALTSWSADAAALRALQAAKVRKVLRLHRTRALLQRLVRRELQRRAFAQLHTAVQQRRAARHITSLTVHSRVRRALVTWNTVTAALRAVAEAAAQQQQAAAAVVAQRVWRMHAARQRMLRLREQRHNAAVAAALTTLAARLGARRSADALQRWAGAVLVFKQQQRAVIQLQSTQRMWLAQCRCRQLRRAHTGLQRLQQRLLQCSVLRSWRTAVQMQAALRKALVHVAAATARAHTHVQPALARWRATAAALRGEQAAADEAAAAAAAAARMDRLHTLVLKLSTCFAAVEHRHAAQALEQWSAAATAAAEEEAAAAAAEAAAARIERLRTGALKLESCIAAVERRHVEEALKQWSDAATAAAEAETAAALACERGVTAAAPQEAAVARMPHRSLASVSTAAAPAHVGLSHSSSSSSSSGSLQTVQGYKAAQQSEERGMSSVMAHQHQHQYLYEAPYYAAPRNGMFYTLMSDQVVELTCRSLIIVLALTLMQMTL
jgi:hypothetical protein